MWPDYCEGCLLTERQAVSSIFSIKLWGLHSGSERWGESGGGRCEPLNHKFLYKRHSKILKPQHPSVIFFCLLISLCVYFFFPQCRFLSLGCLCLSRVLFFLFPLSLRSMSLRLSLIGRHLWLQLGGEKLQSTRQKSNKAANSQTGTQKSQDAYTQSATRTHKRTPTKQDKHTPWDDARATKTKTAQ